MKILVILVVGVMAVISAGAQTQADAVRKRATGKGGNPAPLPSKAVLQAAAFTNFQARCAMDFRWREVTNKIAKAEAALQAAETARGEAARKTSLARQAAGDNTTSFKSPFKAEFEAARNAEERSKKEVAGLKLQKTQIEESIKAVMGARVR